MTGKILSILGIVTTVLGGIATILGSVANSKDGKTENSDYEPPRNNAPKSKSVKYRIMFDGEFEDEVFDGRDAAEEYANYLSSCAKTGAETRNLSNPGDYDADDYNDDYRVVEVDEH